DIEKIELIAKKHGLKVIYDGAHAFGCEYKGKSLLSYGDISTCSFHATKIFHTIEGGCIITNDDEIANKIMLFRQFGHVYDDYFSVGINAKNSEFHAAMGLCILPKINDIILRRKELSERYSLKLKELYLQMPYSTEDLKYNYSYYPVVFKSETELLEIKTALEAEQIFGRRYFYPSLNKLPFVEVQKCVVSELKSESVLCLPLYYDLSTKDVDLISSIISKTLKR
ncbi:MAG: DegT/DnrJ/EryC1/StrS family aminotransferase, partial [Bacteroidia bacterium]